MRQLLYFEYPQPPKTATGPGDVPGSPQKMAFDIFTMEEAVTQGLIEVPPDIRESKIISLAISTKLLITDYSIP